MGGRCLVRCRCLGERLVVSLWVLRWSIGVIYLVLLGDVVKY